jgi:hypothetical protein
MEMQFYQRDGFYLRHPAPQTPDHIRQMEILTDHGWIPVTDANTRADAIWYGIPLKADPSSLEVHASRDPRAIHCPTIGEVSYPSVLKGVSIQYQPGKKKRGRKPKRFEAQLMSLREIPIRLDSTAERLREGLATVIDNPDAAHAMLAEAMGSMARYGCDEVRREFERQRVQVAGTRTLLPDIGTLVTDVATSLQDDLRKAYTDVQKRLDRKRIASASKRAQWTVDLLEPSIAPILTRTSNRAINVAYGHGRQIELRAILLRDDVAQQIHLANPHRDERGRFTTKRGEAYPVDLSQITVIQTAVQDRSLCDECLAVDGETFEYGSERMDELMPPYAKCLGGDNCRCSQLAIVGGDQIDVADVSDQELEDLLQEESS